MDNIKYDISVVGMRVEKFVGVEASEDIDKYEYGTQPCNNEKYILFCVAKIYPNYFRKFTITLWTNGGWCGSGYCHSTWGNMKVKEVDQFGPITHETKDRKPIKIKNAYFTREDGLCFDHICRDYDEKDEDEPNWDGEYYCNYDVKNNVFTYSEINGDEYYPSGFVHVNMDLFNKIGRAFEKRPVWIFSGDSGAGKSTLGYYLHDYKDVYETDSTENGVLPEIIWADIIIVGNKYKFSTADIASHLPKGTEVIVVNFFKGYENE